MHHMVWFCSHFLIVFLAFECCCCSGGDAFLSRCIWQAGYAFTGPGYSFYHWEAKSFDPGPESSRKLVQDFSAALLGACAEEPLVRQPCQQVLIITAVLLPDENHNNTVQ